MSKLFKNEVSKTIFSVVGALMLSSTMIVAAVGPARAAVPQTSVAAHAPLAY